MKNWLLSLNLCVLVIPPPQRPRRRPAPHSLLDWFLSLCGDPERCITNTLGNVREALKVVNYAKLSQSNFQDKFVLIIFLVRRAEEGRMAARTSGIRWLIGEKMKLHNAVSVVREKIDEFYATNARISYDRAVNQFLNKITARLN